MVILGDDALLAGLAALVGRDNQNTCELLAYLGEVEERRLYAERGFDSMWRFCTESLGLCESSAGRRLAAARARRKYPEAFALVARGALKVVAQRPLCGGREASGFEGCVRDDRVKV